MPLAKAHRYPFLGRLAPLISCAIPGAGTTPLLIMQPRPGFPEESMLGRFMCRAIMGRTIKPCKTSACPSRR